MLNLYFILLLLFATTTAKYSEFSLFKRADEPDVGLQQQSDQQASRTIEYDFDLNKTPPRDSDGSPERFSSTPKKKPRGRPRIHATKEEKRMADLNYRKRYRKQYTLSEIEKTKQVLQGEKLREFLAKANDYQTKARIRQEQKRPSKDHTLAKRVDVTNTSAHNSDLQNTNPLVGTPVNVRVLDIDLNHTPPPSPPTVASQSSKLSQESKRRGRKPRYTAEERIQKEKERLFIKARKYNKVPVMKAKSTMKGEELEEYLRKAHAFRINKRVRDTKERERVSQRFLNGTQTFQDEKSRKSAVQRAIQYRERKRNKETNS